MMADDDSGSRAKNASGRRLIIVRHGERIDSCFGDDWTEKYFDADGEWLRRDLNLPMSVPPRARAADHKDDPPLTMAGQFQAMITGEALHRAGVKVTAVYCSPAMRVMQTAALVLEAWGRKDMAINVEPALFEWLYAYEEKPKLFTPEQFAALGMNVNLDYKPHLSYDQILSAPRDESVAQFFGRSFDLTKTVLAETEGDVMFFAHASSLGVCTRQLVGGAVPDRDEFIAAQMTRTTPHGAVVAVQELECDKWHFVDPPIPTLVHKDNKDWDWRSLV